MFARRAACVFVVVLSGCLAAPAPKSAPEAPLANGCARASYAVPTVLYGQVHGGDASTTLFVVREGGGGEATALDSMGCFTVDVAFGNLTVAAVGQGRASEVLHLSFTSGPLEVLLRLPPA